MVVLLFAAPLHSVHAQRSNVTKSRNHYSTPKVRGSKAKIVCPVFVNSKYPFHTLGFKIGDPFAVSYKFYPQKRWSFALDVGKPASGLYRDYFRDQFGTYLKSDTMPSESSLSYLAHRVKLDLVVEAKVAYQIDASHISEGLQFYIGGGWEWKKSELVYDYEYNAPLQPSDPFGAFGRTRTAMGPQVMAGVEYAYFAVPVVAFMEVEYFTDIQTDPGWTRFEGGVGLRYVF